MDKRKFTALPNQERTVTSTRQCLAWQDLLVSLTYLLRRTKQTKKRVSDKFSGCPGNRTVRISAGCVDLHMIYTVALQTCSLKKIIPNSGTCWPVEWKSRSPKSEFSLMILSMAFSPQANYNDWTTATCWRNLVPTFADRVVSCGQRGGLPTVVNLSFLDRSC
jgi:hypothetical protein